MTGIGFGGMNKGLDQQNEIDALRKALGSLVEACDGLCEISNRTLGRGAARIQAAVINKFRRQIESARTELEASK